MTLANSPFEFASPPRSPAEVIEAHSHSFSLATRMLPSSLRDDVRKLYAWCRWCDDAVDDAPTVEIAKRRLNLLSRDIDLIADGQNVAHPISEWLRELADKHGLPLQPARDLLSGMKQDLEDPCFETVDDLLRYCYQVAGTVGILMCRMMGVHDRVAISKARALGMAMQLTNIARDVREDWELNRRYIPHSWLPKDPNADQAPSNNEVRPAVEMLLALADRFYSKGHSGLKYLPSRARLAIRLAGDVYREIGCEIRRRNYSVMDRRISISLSKRLSVAVKSVGDEMVSRLSRAMRVDFSFAHRRRPTLNIWSETMKDDSKYLVGLGISLVLVMSATLFTLVAINPKDDAYSALPWTYAATCLVLAAVSGWVTSRFAKSPQPAAVYIREPNRRDG